MSLLLQVLLTDTVGFIQKLPTQLVAAFRATLEEITEASLLLHVVDVSHPNAAAQTQAVMQVCWDTAVMRAGQLSCLTFFFKAKTFMVDLGRPSSATPLEKFCTLTSVPNLGFALQSYAKGSMLTWPVMSADRCWRILMWVTYQ